MPIIANVILASQVPSLLGLYLGIPVLLIETVIFWRRNRDISGLRSTGLILAANVISLMAGVLLSVFLPPGTTRHPSGGMTTGPNYMVWVHINIFVAFALSWLIEHHFLRFALRKARPHNLLMTTGLMNIASYVFLYLILLMVGSG